MTSAEFGSEDEEGHEILTAAAMACNIAIYYCQILIMGVRA